MPDAQSEQCRCGANLRDGVCTSSGRTPKDCKANPFGFHYPVRVAEPDINPVEILANLELAKEHAEAAIIHANAGNTPDALKYARLAEWQCEKAARLSVKLRTLLADRANRT